MRLSRRRQAPTASTERAAPAASISSGARQSWPALLPPPAESVQEILRPRLRQCREARGRGGALWNGVARTVKPSAPVGRRRQRRPLLAPAVEVAEAGPTAPNWDLTPLALASTPSAL